MKSWWKSGVLLIPSILLPLIPATSSYAETRSIRVGVIAPLTGFAASSGAAVKNSVALADREFDQENQVEFIFEDDQSIPKNTVSAVRKLIQLDRVSALIVFGSTPSFAVTEIVEQAKIPMLALASSDGVVSGKRYVMKHFLSSAVETVRIVEEVRKRGYKSVAIVSTIMEGTIELRERFLASVPPGTKVVLTEELVRDNLDFYSIISRIKMARPEAVYLILWAPQPGVFARTLRDSGYYGDIFASHLIEDLNEIRLSNGALDGTWFVSTDDRFAHEYYERYRKDFGTTPAIGGTNAYDAATILIKGSAAPDLNAYLHSVKDFTGAFGTYGATSTNDFGIPMVLKVIRGGSFKTL